MTQYQARRKPGYTALALAIVALAVKDVHRANGYAGDAVEFLSSDWGQRLAIELDLDNTIHDWLQSHDIRRIDNNEHNASV